MLRYVDGICGGVVPASVLEKYVFGQVKTEEEYDHGDAYAASKLV